VEKYDIVFALNNENGTKVAKLAKDFGIPTMTLTTVSKNIDKIISHLSLSEYTRKHHTVSGNHYKITCF